MDTSEKLLRRIDDNLTLQKLKNKRNLKSLYINGDLRVLGSKNLYGIWNTWIFKLYKSTHGTAKKKL